MAALLGGVRTGVTGINTNDVVHPTLAVEVKARKRLPKLVTDAMAQARAAHKARGKLPVVFLIAEGQQIHKGLVVAQLEDIDGWLGQNDEPEIQRAWDRHLDHEVERLQAELDDARRVIAALRKFTKPLEEGWE